MSIKQNRLQVWRKSNITLLFRGKFWKNKTLDRKCCSLASHDSDRNGKASFTQERLPTSPFWSIPKSMHSHRYRKKFSKRFQNRSRYWAIGESEPEIRPIICKHTIPSPSEQENLVSTCQVTPKIHFLNVSKKTQFFQLVHQVKFMNQHFVSFQCPIYT